MIKYKQEFLCCGGKRMNSRSRFQDLTIRNGFMFSAVMLREDNSKKFLEMLLQVPIKEVVVSYEKSLIYNPECKGVRLDVYIKDDKNTRYDIELQVAHQELGKRTRYYHSQMDMDLLESGQEYKELPMSYVIFICDFDPFKKGKYCYTFENRCLEEFALDMGDESRSIFLSTEGKDGDKIPKELRAFLEFIKTDNAQNNIETEDDYVKELQKTIRSIKENRELERSFMTWEDIRREARWEGKLEGKREAIMELLEDLGIIPEELKNRIMSETKEEELKLMFKFASKATSFEDFKDNISTM